MKQPTKQVKTSDYKQYKTALAAIFDIADGATIMLHAFSGPAGIAQDLLLALRERNVKKLTLITCGVGLAYSRFQKLGMNTSIITPNILAENGQVRKIISAWTVMSRGMFGGKSAAMEEQIKEGEIEWEPVSQGVLANRIWAGAAGIGGFYSPTGIGTILEKGKEKRTINDREYMLETPLRADYAFVRAYKADKWGNLIYRGTGRSFNPLLAMAADVTIAEVDEIGEIDPEQVVTPMVFVNRIVQSTRRVE